MTATDSDFLTALSCPPLLEPADATGALELRRNGLEADIDALDRDRAHVEPVPDHVGAMFVSARSRLSAAHTWLTAFLDDLPTARSEAES